MTNVINFPRDDSFAKTAAMLAAFTDRACAGHFSGAIVLGMTEDGPTFQMCTSNASMSDLLAAMGALDLIKARLARVVEAEQDDQDDGDDPA